MTSLEDLTALYDGAEQYFGGAFIQIKLAREVQNKSIFSMILFSRACFNLLQQRWDKPYRGMEKVPGCQHCERKGRQRRQKDKNRQNRQKDKTRQNPTKQTKTDN